MARQRRHLSVVETEHDKREAMAAALRQVAGRVPVERMPVWRSLGGGAFFEAINPYIADGRLTLDDVEGFLEGFVSCSGMRDAYYSWLRTQR